MGDGSISAVLMVGAAALLWVGILGLLWRRSLVGMLVGLLFCWFSVGMFGLAVGGLFSSEATRAQGAAFVLIASILGGLQAALGLGVIVARIKRRGTLDADDAGLLEG